MECNKCQVANCQSCRELAKGAVQCRDRFLKCCGCGKLHCTIHLVASVDDLQKGSYYCHGCAILFYPSGLTRRHTKKNYETQERCGGCTSEPGCPSCKGRKVSATVCLCSTQYPTIKCHDCERWFCDSHLHIQEESMKVLVEHLREATEMVSRCHACHFTYLKGKYQCSHCKQRFENPLQVCSGCRAREYCGKECQRKDWSQGHKRTCQISLL
jgi:hypothetical protein